MLSLPIYGIILAICAASSGFLSALKWTVGAKLIQDVIPCGIPYDAPIACPILWLNPTFEVNESENREEYAAIRSFCRTSTSAGYL